MKKQLLILGLIFSFHSFTKEAEKERKDLTAQDLMEHGQKWAKQMGQKLNQEELLLLANYLYFNFLATRYDYIIQTSFILCQNHLTSMQFLLNSKTDEAYKNAETIAKQLALLTQEAIPLRSYTEKASQACFEHIEDSDLPALKKVITNFQQYASGAVNQFIQQDWPKSITMLFSKCAESMKNESEKLVICQKDLENKAHIDTFLDTPELIGENFQQAINSAHMCYASYLTLIAHTLNVKSMSADILNISALIYNMFYNALLDQMKTTKKMVDCPLMFDENGFIEEDDQDEYLLPLDEKFSVNKKHLKLS